MPNSSAEIFFRGLFIEGADGFEQLSNLILERAEENEWREFKGAEFFDSLQPEKERDATIKKYWSENLSAFANSGGGILIWGISAPKDHAEAKSFPRSAINLADRLKKLQNDAVEPIVAGIEVRAVLEPGTLTGFVVCFIPNSVFAPHCAKWAEGGYYIRGHDSNARMRPEVLRRMFHPHSMPRLVPLVKLQCPRADKGLLKISLQVTLRNRGAATARDTLVRLKLESDRIFTPWRSSAWNEKLGNEFTHLGAIHPGERVPLLRNWTHETGYASLEELPDSIRCTFEIFSENAAALFGEMDFTNADLRASFENSIEREARVSPLPLDENR